MRKIIFTLIFTILLFCGCSSSKTIYDTERTVIVENIEYNTMNHNSKYIVKAWSYKPNIKEYKIYTDSLYNIGQKIVIKGKK